jgi:hypothetical protein
MAMAELAPHRCLAGQHRALCRMAQQFVAPLALAAPVALAVPL